MTDSSMGYQQFFAELKRRHVFKVAAIYGAVAFGVLQVAEPLGTALGLSDSFLSLVVGLLLLGFPVALVLAWAFEVTPEGVQKAEPAAPGEIEAIVAQPASKRWPAGLLALAGAALLFGGWWMGRQGSPGTDRDLNLSIPSAQAADFQTIAVLPFENMGGDEENLVLTTGLHADVESQLTQLADLRVVFVQDYDRAETTVKEIAQALSVDHVLRGRVRRSGDQVRVNISLIDVATSENLWVKEFDRAITPENLFAIQADIARQVALELEAELSPQVLERLEAGLSTDDMAALNLYYRSVASGEQISSRISFLEAAVALDSGFVEAWGRLARFRSVLVRLGEGGEAEALEAVQRVEALARGSLEALKTRGYYTRDVEKDAESALLTLRAAERLAPSDTTLVGAIGDLQMDLGDLNGGLATLRRAVALDPQNRSPLHNLVSGLRGMARWEAADQVVERILSIDPSDSGAKAWKIDLSLALDRDPRGARALAAELALDPTIWPERWALIWLARYERDWEAARQALESWPRSELAAGDVNRLTLLAGIHQKLTGTPGPYADSLSLLFERASLLEVRKPFAANALILAGQKEEGLAMLAEAVEEGRTMGIGSAGEVWFEATIYSHHGFPDRAFELLNEAVGKPTFGWTFIGHAAFLESVSFDGIRDDPRFQAVLDRQLAYEAQAALEAEAEGPWP